MTTIIYFQTTYRTFEAIKNVNRINSQKKYIYIYEKCSSSREQKPVVKHTQSTINQELIGIKVKRESFIYLRARQGSKRL